MHLALFGDIILIVLLPFILNCCVDPVPVRNDYFGGGVCMSVYYDLFHMTGYVSLFKRSETWCLGRSLTCLCFALLNGN